MKEICKKSIVIGIILLLLGIGIHPAFAMYTKTSSVSEIHNKGVDLALAEIIPYKYYELDPNGYILIFGPRIKNVGDEDYNGDIGYTGVAINLRNNKEVDTCQIKYSGSLKAGESYYDNLGGLIFEVGPLIPTLYSLRFTATPSDSNPDNNYREETYLIRAGLWGPEYIYIPNTRNLNTNNNQNEECRECQSVSESDLIRVERLLDRVEVYNKLLLMLPKDYPKVREKCKEILGVINSNRPWDFPIICNMIEKILNKLMGIIDYIYEKGNELIEAGKYELAKFYALFWWLFMSIYPEIAGFGSYIGCWEEPPEP
jgi:hypothetical protein